MTNIAIAASIVAAAPFTHTINDPAQLEMWKNRILTFKGTPAVPTGGCGVGAYENPLRPNPDTATNIVADLLCSAGANTPQDWEEIGNIVLTKGDRTDTLNY
jgi:hypothetical protein